MSFLVLSMFWLHHNALFSFFAKNVNRPLILLNMLYLCTIAFIPFSAHLIGSYPENELAFVIYGLNLFVSGGANYLLLKYAILAKEIDTDHVPIRIFKQGAIRVTMTPFFSLFGILAALLGWLPIALVLFTFPILFNILPGGVDFLEKKLRLKLG
ncbi:MAG: TMEM175 family protein [Candidatus Moraniibacteriota bacterium]